ncbi:hypothetical protein VPH35_140404 [Triticum aestivum]
MNASGRRTINPPRSVVGRHISLWFPPPTTPPNEPIRRWSESNQTTMADWRMMVELAMVELASGDKEKLERAREIVSWFTTRKEMRHVAKEMFRNLTAEEDERLTPNGFTTPSGAPVSPLVALVWAMEEMEFGDLAQKQKWWGFRSRHRFSAGREEFVVGAVMAIPTPRTRWVPILIEDSKEEEQLDTGAQMTAADLAKDGEGEEKQKIYTPRRSPRFLRRSPRLLSLSHSVAAE